MTALMCGETSDWLQASYQGSRRKGDVTFTFDKAAWTRATVLKKAKDMAWILLEEENWLVDNGRPRQLKKLQSEDISIYSPTRHYNHHV
ncbi:high-affinity hexose transporter [Aspergillus luchuensis]|uniref:High-affinity hexose transporter n=1 Tax=Aspergillus kawachii TaxID=1069201 RepID=A0A146FQ80_ASPKA|nr:high-affinity hexose transporter [Aspergillus luchuensis]